MVTPAAFAQFTPVVLMMGVIAINHLINNQRSDRKTASEASRFRSALAAELRGLLELYNENLQLIAQRADHILSTRSSLIVYKGNLGRLAMLLDDSLIEQIVGVYAQNERIEATIAARSNFKCGLTYQFAVADANFDDWRNLFDQAAANVLHVLRMLAGNNRISVAGKTPARLPDIFRQPTIGVQV
jgi:hypothetical protein